MGLKTQIQLIKQGIHRSNRSKSSINRINGTTISIKTTTNLLTIKLMLIVGGTTTMTIGNLCSKNIQMHLVVANKLANKIENKDKIIITIVIVITRALMILIRLK
jgi:hypothetical protein